MRAFVPVLSVIAVLRPLTSKPSSCSSSYTIRLLVRCPMAVSSTASLSVLVRTLAGPAQSGLRLSRVAGSIRFSRSRSNAGSVSTVRFRPPPGLRMRVVFRSFGCSSSCNPFITVAVPCSVLAQSGIRRPIRTLWLLLLQTVAFVVHSKTARLHLI